MPGCLLSAFSNPPLILSTLRYAETDACELKAEALIFCLPLSLTTGRWGARDEDGGVDGEVG